jgi:NAD(P)-dependent dehydrogenase (short-subunit alcohol dehydrogenase family)|tara:strand:+ start:2331 stop:3089 length:759 start_codon:yes stop_codon:yes gene_type:complete
MPIPPQWNLQGKTALLTTSGHFATPFLAAALAEAGARVTVAGGPHDALEAARQATSAYSDVAIFPADVTDPASVRGVVQQAIDVHGGLDLLVNNCQLAAAKPFLETDLEEFDQVLTHNLHSVFLFCQTAAKHMQSQGAGRIVNVSSALAERGVENMAAYCASMAGIAQLTRVLGLELSRTAIRVNGIGPGWFIGEERSLEDQRQELFARFLPSRRYGHPRDLAALLVYLCSDVCGFVTGHTIFVDGGALARL